MLNGADLVSELLIVKGGSLIKMSQAGGGF